MKRKHPFKSIFIKFVFAFILVGLLPLMGISYFVFEKLPNEMEKQIIANYNQILLYTARNIRMKADEYNQISQLPYNYQSDSYDTVAQALEEEDGPFLEDFLRSVIYSERQIESAFLLDEDWDVIGYFTQNANAVLDDFNWSGLIGDKELFGNVRDLVSLPPHGEEYFFRSESRVMSFIRNYLDINQLPEEEQILARLAIEVNVDFLKEILDPLSEDPHVGIFILDDRGRLYYDSGTNLLNDPNITRKELLRLASEEAGFSMNKRGYLFYRPIENLGWTVFFEVHHSSIYQVTSENLKLGLIVMAVLTLILLFLAMVFSRALYDPIKTIIHQMKQVESGDFSSEVKVDSHDEIQQLAQAFNRMIRRLNIYIQKAFVAQIRQKESELTAIRNQIRPHYLYNTLEIIRMVALDEEAENTQNMIVSLSEQLKYVLGYNEKEVSLKEELEMVRHYFSIAAVRYENRFTLELDIPPLLLSCRVLKLTVQPLVENAVIHGLKPKKGKGRVSISAQSEGGMVAVKVMDDGVGMDREELERLTSVLSKGADSSQYRDEHIGLKNVHDRIRLIYGDRCGLDISSKRNAGTMATLYFPEAREEG